MVESLATSLGYKALDKGLRLPRSKRLVDIDQQCRTIHEIKRHGVDLVLEVGANRGFYARHLRLMGYAGDIFSFEPDIATFAHLENKAKRDPPWKVFNCALGEAEGEMDFNVIHTGEETALKPLGELDVTLRRVPVRTIEELLRSEGVADGRRIYLKVDTQGYDLNVFYGLGSIAGVILLQSETSVVPLYEGMPHYTDALLCDEKAGYDLLDRFVVNRTPSGAVLKYDALMPHTRFAG
jgi:FkbM family methyltransferase